MTPSERRSRHIHPVVFDTPLWNMSEESDRGEERLAGRGIRGASQSPPGGGIPDARPVAFQFGIRHDRIVGIDLVAEPDRLSELDVAMLDD
jgi:hypothetical protein